MDDELGAKSMKKKAMEPLISKNQVPESLPKNIEMQNFEKEAAPHNQKSKLPQINHLSQPKKFQKKTDLGDNEVEEEEFLISKGNNNNGQEVEEPFRDDIPLWE